MNVTPSCMPPAVRLVAAPMRSATAPTMVRSAKAGACAQTTLARMDRFLYGPRVSSSARDWRQIPEAGTVLGLRFMLASCRVLGRRVTRAVVYVIVFYYALLARGARAASREYLQRAGRPHGFWDVYRHLLCFGHTVLDRVYFVQDDFDAFDITLDGHEHMQRLAESGRGAILLGAHLGSFEVMRTQSTKYRIPINVVGDFSNAERINSVLRKLNPKLDTKLISVSEGAIKLALKIRAAIDRGELVAILGDRGGEGDSMTAEFLGGQVRFPTGPYLLAATLRCPVYLTVALHHPPSGYALYCEPFAEQVVLPRGKRREAMRPYVERYAQRLAHYCSLAPDNWFNFYSVWEGAGEAALTAGADGTADAAAPAVTDRSASPTNDPATAGTARESR